MVGTKVVFDPFKLLNYTTHAKNNLTLLPWTRRSLNVRKVNKLIVKQMKTPCCPTMRDQCRTGGVEHKVDTVI